MEIQTPEEVSRRLAAAQQTVAGETPSDQTTEVHPPTPGGEKPTSFVLTSAVVDNLIGFVSNPTERWYLGLSEIDLATRGVGRGEVMMVVGRSHTGKSQMLFQWMNHASWSQ